MSPLFRSRLRVLIAAGLFSTAGAAIKATSLGSFQTAGWRAAAAALTIGVLLPETRRRLTRKTALVALAYAATTILFVQANKLTTAANATFIQSSSTLYVLLLGPKLLGEHVGRRELGYLAMIAIGVAFFFVGVDPAATTAPQPLLGNGIAGVSGFTSGLLMIGLRWLAREEHLGSASAVLLGNIFAALVCLPWLLQPGPLGFANLALVAYLGVFQIGLAFAFVTRAMADLPALETSLLLFMEPVLAPLWALLFHGERPGLWSSLGCASIFAATIARCLGDWRRASGVVARFTPR